MGEPRKPRISESALKEVEGALREYIHEVMQAGYGQMSENMHVDKANYFVRWLKRDFTPGERLGRRPKIEP